MREGSYASEGQVSRLILDSVLRSYVYSDSELRARKSAGFEEAGGGKNRSLGQRSIFVDRTAETKGRWKGLISKGGQDKGWDQDRQAAFEHFRSEAWSLDAQLTKVSRERDCFAEELAAERGAGRQVHPSGSGFPREQSQTQRAERPAHSLARRRRSDPRSVAYAPKPPSAPARTRSGSPSRMSNGWSRRSSPISPQSSSRNWGRILRGGIPCRRPQSSGSSINCCARCARIWPRSPVSVRSWRCWWISRGR